MIVLAIIKLVLATYILVLVVCINALLFASITLAEAGTMALFYVRKSGCSWRRVKTAKADRKYTNPFLTYYFLYLKKEKSNTFQTGF
jgi:hypothetical protein